MRRNKLDKSGVIAYNSDAINKERRTPMNTTYTKESLSAASELCHVVPNTEPGKALLASMMADAFINGMTARERLMSALEERRK